MKYRKEIDGLRAVAVLPVIFFHAGFSFFSGGYIGVDVFFVISGYLITSILVEEIEQGNFSIVHFYERRARRILPALFVIMLACLPFAYMWMLPSQLKDFSQSLVAVIFFTSNVLFWREDGYFGPDAELKPLLHTWSLAVEEQYYLLFPIFLIALWRFGRHRVFWSVITVAVFSFLLAEWGWRNNPTANFYLAPTRAWELLAGSICAFTTVRRAQRSSNVLSALGLSLIVFAIIMYDETTQFPSVYTIVPVLGTALVIIFAAEGTLVSKLLGIRIFVGIGIISYSAYLWHQPLFAFARLRSLIEPSQALMAVLSVLSLLLALATWYLVEQTFRRRSNHLLVTRRSVFAVSGVVGAAFIAVGLAGHASEGFEWRFDEEILRLAKAENDRALRSDGCFLGPGTELPIHPVRQCEFRGPKNEIELILLGDSHSLSISEELGKALSEEEIGFYKIGYSRCIPLQGFRMFEIIGGDECSAFNDTVIEYAQIIGVKTVVITGRFPLYLRGDRFDNGEGGVEAGQVAWVDLLDRTQSEWNDEGRRVRVLAAYAQRIRELAQKFKVVLGHIPINGIPKRGRL